MGLITIFVTTKINLLANLFNLGRIKIANSVSNISNNKNILNLHLFIFF